MDSVVPDVTLTGKKINILSKIPTVIAYTILVELTDVDLLHVRRTCPEWKKLLDKDEFWEMKILKEKLDVAAIARSSNIEEFMSYFKSRHHGMFRYFNRLKWNWKGKWFEKVQLHPDIREVLTLDEEVLMYVLNSDDDNGIKIVDPATGEVKKPVLAKEMGAVIRVKKSGKFIVAENSCHKVKCFDGLTNMVLSEIQESSALTHLMLQYNIIISKTTDDSMFTVWDGINGEVHCKFYDASAKVGVDYENHLIATDNVNDRRVRVWKLMHGELLYASRVYSTAVKQILIQDYMLIVVECSGQISMNDWMPGSYSNEERTFQTRPNSKVRRLDNERFAYITLDKIFYIQKTTLVGDCLHTIRTENCIKKIKSNNQFIFALCENVLNLYDINNYTFLQKIEYPFQENTLVCKITESKLLFQKVLSNSADQFYLYDFAPRSLRKNDF